MINCILGAGQVGNVLKDSLHGDINIYDIGEWEKLTDIKCDILHIAIPYGPKFKHTVITAKWAFKPKFTIIHSTVKPGTSKGIADLYSPIMGRHSDDFSENVRGYVKYFAGEYTAYTEVRAAFKLKTDYWSANTEELEYSKVMSTTRMYWDLIFQKEVQNDCELKGYNFEAVNRDWNMNYNNGIKQKHPHWLRPIYRRMETDTPGGHCLRPNIHLTDNEITKYIRKWEK